MALSRSIRRKALGQHFLHDRRIIESIVNAAVEESVRSHAQQVLEIGPGKGALTELLRQKDLKAFTVCEKDPALAGHWKSVPGLRVLEGDFLNQPESQWLDPSPLVVVSNLPYSSGTAILNRLVTHTQKIGAMVLMFQAEVAQRLRAQRGTKAWGSLTLWVQNLWDVQLLHTVPPGAFSPPPKVVSEVVILRPLAQPRIPETTAHPAALEAWESLLKTCFAHRRKMLRSALPKQGPYRRALDESGIPSDLRAEALGWEEWTRLFRSFYRN